MNEEGRLSVGATLKKAREEKGLSLQEVESQIFIIEKHLEYLEADNWDALPGHSYALGYIKIYARLLGLDDTKLVEQWKRSLSQEPSPSQERRIVKKREEKRRAKKINRLFRKILILLVVLTAFFSVLFVILNLDTEGDTAEYPIVEHVSPVPSPTPDDTVAVIPATPPEEEEEEFAISLLLSAEDLAWLEVASEGNTVFADILVPGKEYTFRSNLPLELSGRDGDQVLVFLNGTDIGTLAEEGQEFSRVFTP